MRRWPVFALALVLAPALVPLLPARGADETSSGDKLRILYSSRFTFTDDQIPLVTIEITSGDEEIRLSSAGGLAVLPDGDGGARIEAAGLWRVRAEDVTPAVTREWTVVERLPPEEGERADAALALWKRRGLEARTFEIGSIFGIRGEVIDSREILVAVAPSPAGKGERRAAAIGREHGIETSLHHELIRPPRGTLVAKNGEAVIRNASVLWFAPQRPGETVNVADVVVGGGGSQLDTRREARRYFGMIYVTLGSDGALTAVNAVAADRLLAGLVPAEIFASAPDEALAAQAIAARTELLEKIGTRHFGDPYLLCSSQHCQVYSGAGNEHPRTTRAVERTRGMVLLRDDGGLVDARYSASCGGHGEHNENVWGGRADPSLRGRLDAPSKSQLSRFSEVTEENVAAFLAETGEAYCAHTRFSPGRHRWAALLPADALSSSLVEEHPGLGRVRAIEPLERGVSGRIHRLRLRGDRGSAEVTGELRIRRLLGGLKSSLFTVDTVGDPRVPEAFRIRGGGFGHGVGLCQLGAIGMAEKRANFREILGHYYPGSRVRRLY